MRKWIPLTLAAVVTAAGLQTSARAEDAPIEIGVIANLTGPDVKTSLQMSRGVELAADDINAAGGINGHPVKLIVEDSEYRAQEALNAATKLYTVDKVPAAIMFGGSSLMIPVAQMAKEQGKILINTSSSSPKLGEYPGTLFSILPLDDIVSKDLGDMIADAGIKTAAVVVPNNAFGLGVADAATAEFEARGGKVVEKIAYTEGQPDYRADVQVLVGDDVGAIIATGYGDDSRTVFRNMRELGIDAPWYAAYPSILDVENPEWMNGKLTGVDNGGYGQGVGEKVLAEYKAKYGDEDVLAHIYYGYDALMVLAKAMEKSGTEPADIAKALPEVVKDYQGATGTIVWDDRGQRIDPPIDVITYEDGKFVTTGHRN
ncbi:ABC transporter substrate-binding protein [Martelella sp. HB161492]|uniref:ABC transporter substrate-binding protein n=1 Tax=Martelella sp. HB161492 TaxID=2720726 RepID=UPI001592390E|nr:ABC transporter substrate-binding protein [Martelella sp. HB161492]